MTIFMPVMGDGQEQAWHALMDMQESHPAGWTLVGGQMVHLHCAERGASPTRPTDDVDAVLDVRADPRIFHAFTSSLSRLGFAPAGNTWQGHQHRWERGDAVIDLLIPAHLGERASKRTGAGGGTTLETPGAQQALDRSEEVEVDVGGRVGVIRRPNLLGALVAKSAAYTVSLDPARNRHITDFAVLSALIRPIDQIHTATKRDRQYLGNMLAATRSDELAWAGVEGARDGFAKLRLGLAPRDAEPNLGSRRIPTNPWMQGHKPKGAPSGGEFNEKPLPESEVDL